MRGCFRIIAYSKRPSLYFHLIHLCQRIGFRRLGPIDLFQVRVRASFSRSARPIGYVTFRCFSASMNHPNGKLKISFAMKGRGKFPPLSLSLARSFSPTAKSLFVFCDFCIHFLEWWPLAYSRKARYKELRNSNTLVIHFETNHGC